MVSFTTDQWVIIGLVFLLGLLLGMFLTAGGRRKWKRRYYDERKRCQELEHEHRAREEHWEGREREWRDGDSRRDEPVRDRRDDDRPR